MKSLSFSLTLLLVTFFCYAEGKATWLNTMHDFGTFNENAGKVSCEMKMINTGDDNIKITDVKATCGCTATSHTSGNIAPGDTATVTITYNANGRPGRFDKNIYVYTDGTPQKSVLKIKGNVIGSTETINREFPHAIGALKLKNMIVPFGEITKGKSRTRFISLYNQSNDTMTAVFHDVPSHIQVEMIPQFIAPGEIATITITFHSEKKEDWGFTQDFFTMESLPSSFSNNAVAGIGNLNVTAILREHFDKTSAKESTKYPVAKLSTTKIDCGSITKQENNITASFELFNTGKSKLNIRKIYSLDKGIVINYKNTTIKPGKSVKVAVDINPRVLNDVLNAKIEVFTNDPNNSWQTIRLVGLVKN